MASDAARPADEVASRIRSLVESKRNVRSIVEEMRVLSYHPPTPTLLTPLLGALQLLKANKKAGEENKAIRQVYQYLDMLLGGGLLVEGEAMLLMHQLLRVDLDDDLLPRRLAALALYGRAAALFPAVDPAPGFPVVLQPFLADAASAVAEDSLGAAASVVSRRGPGGGAAGGGGGGGGSAGGAGSGGGSGSGASNSGGSGSGGGGGGGGGATNELALATAASVYAALAAAAGTDAQPHAALSTYLRSGLTSVQRDVCVSSSAALARAAARSVDPASAAKDVAFFEAQSKAFAEYQRAVAAASAAGSAGAAGAPRTSGFLSKLGGKKDSAQQSAAAAIAALGPPVPKPALPVSVQQLQELLVEVAPFPWPGAIPLAAFFPAVPPIPVSGLAANGGAGSSGGAPSSSSSSSTDASAGGSPRVQRTTSSAVAAAAMASPTAAGAKGATPRPSPRDSLAADAAGTANVPKGAGSFFQAAEEDACVQFVRAAAVLAGIPLQDLIAARLPADAAAAAGPLPFDPLRIAAGKSAGAAEAVFRHSGTLAQFETLPQLVRPHRDQARARTAAEVAAIAATAAGSASQSASGGTRGGGGSSGAGSGAGTAAGGGGGAGGHASSSGDAVSSVPASSAAGSSQPSSSAAGPSLATSHIFNLYGGTSGSRPAAGSSASAASSSDTAHLSLPPLPVHLLAPTPVTPLQAECYKVLTAAALDGRHRVRLEAAKLIAAGGIPRLVEAPLEERLGRLDHDEEEEDDDATAAHDGGARGLGTVSDRALRIAQEVGESAAQSFVAVVASVSHSIRTGLEQRSQPLICAGLRGAIALGASFSAWEARLSRRLRRGWIVHVRSSASAKGGPGGGAHSASAAAAWRAGGYGSHVGRPGARPTADVKVGRRGGGASSLPSLPPFALLAAWSRCADAIASLLVDAIVRTMMACDTAAPDTGYEHVVSLAVLAAAWCSPALAHALPPERDLHADADAISPFLARLCGHGVPPRNQQLQLDAVAVVRLLVPDPAAAMRLRLAGWAGRAFLVDACERLEQTALWSVFLAVADRALLVGMEDCPCAGGGAAALSAQLLAGVTAIWLQRSVGWTLDAVGLSGSGSGGVGGGGSTVAVPVGQGPDAAGLPLATGPTGPRRRPNTAHPAAVDAYVSSAASLRVYALRTLLAGSGAGFPLTSVPLLHSSASQRMIVCTWDLLRALSLAGSAAAARALRASLVAVSGLPRPESFPTSGALYVAVGQALANLQAASSAAVGRSKGGAASSGGRGAVAVRPPAPAKALPGTPSSWGAVAAWPVPLALPAPGPGVLAGGHQFSLVSGARHQLAGRISRLADWYLRVGPGLGGEDGREPAAVASAAAAAASRRVDAVLAQHAQLQAGKRAPKAIVRVLGPGGGGPSGGGGGPSSVGGLRSGSATKGAQGKGKGAAKGRRAEESRPPQRVGAHGRHVAYGAACMAALTMLGLGETGKRAVTTRG
jgi:hypothetical protein